MAAIDIIRDMDDAEIIWYYKYCMVQRYEGLRHIFGHYHPSFDHNSIELGKYTERHFSLYWPNEEFLLSEMWDRYINAETFAKKCWWEAKKVFNTKVSYPRTEERKGFIVNINSSDRKNNKRIETIQYDSVIYKFLSGGTKRKVYVSPDKTHVIKVGRESSVGLGEAENLREAKMYAENPNSIYAKCELIENNWLKMEYVTPSNFSKDDDYPEWTLQIADHQVGLNNEGKLVAYDYGSDI